MKLINKSIYVLVLSLFMVVAFSQQSSFEKNNLSNNLTNELSPRAEISSTTEQVENQQEVLSDGNPGGEYVPIDDYQFYLVGLGVLLTGIVVYRRNQLEKA